MTIHETAKEIVEALEEVTRADASVQSFLQVQAKAKDALDIAPRLVAVLARLGKEPDEHFTNNVAVAAYLSMLDKRGRAVSGMTLDTDALKAAINAYRRYVLEEAM